MTFKNLSSIYSKIFSGFFVVFLECTSYVFLLIIINSVHINLIIISVPHSGGNRDPASHCRGTLLFVYGLLSDLLEMTLMEPPHGHCLDGEAWSAIWKRRTGESNHQDTHRLLHIPTFYLFL